uniref:Uncharacterized protein n=1 Tax=Panagrolaimus sp. ES5 TaxID=591445 RepID=A0AC34FAP3_9BILA
MCIAYGRERQKEFIRRRYMKSPTVFPSKRTPSIKFSSRPVSTLQLPPPPLSPGEIRSGPIESDNFHGKTTSV